jgi:hypothetical protein
MSARNTSERLAMPEASSSAPGATLPLWLIESRWPPTTTTSLASVLPGIVAITDFCVQPVSNSSIVTSGRFTAYPVHRLRSHVEDWPPPVEV